MKKFMKAIAFVTVMCMALSTVAFAHQVPTTAEDKTFTVTVEGAGSEQVALMVVAKDAADFSDPLYIDQMGATGGTAKFTAKIARDVDAVDVYVGYASNTLVGGKAPKIGTVTLKEAVTKVTVTKANVTLLKEKQAESDIGQIYTVEFEVEAPQNSTVTATNMIWAITYTDGSKTDTVYSKAIDASDYGIGAAMSGAVKLAVAFNNGSVGRDLRSVKIDTIDAIFLFSDDSEAATGNFSADDSRNISGGN